MAAHCVGGWRFAYPPACYADLAERLREHGLPNESETTIKAKLKRGAFSATFLLATLAALEMEGLRLEGL